MKTSLEIIGSTEYIDVAGIKNVPAKIDTGADSSSIWASHISVDKANCLHFQLFDKDSPYYTGETLTRKDFKVAIIRSASGHEQIRYRTHLSARIRGRTIKVLFSLSNRSSHNYPILIGKRTINKKFLVDVSKKHTKVQPKKTKTKNLQKSFEKNPYEFHQKFIQNKITKTERSGL